MHAFILAAGLGERLRPHTERVPKPLIEVQGRSLIEHHLRALSKAGFRDVVINICHLGDQIQNHLGDGGDYGLNISYADERESGVQGTYMGVHNVLNRMPNAPFLLLSADIFCDYDFQKCMTWCPKMAHVVLVPNPSWHPAGDFACVDQRLIMGPPRPMTYANIGVFHPDFFRQPQAISYSLGDALRNHIKVSDIEAELYQGRWHNVGTVAQWREVASPTDRLP